MRSATTSPVTVLLMASVIGCGDGKTKTSADGDKTPDIIGLTAGVEAGQQWQGNGLKFCWCPPGRFTMGSPKNEKDRSVNEDQVSVTLTRGFWLGTYEVTQAQWNSVMKTRPWKGEDYVKEGDDYAASYISWEDAVKFCVELTKQDRLSGKLPAGWTYRLPTEAQWEYACRAGSKTQYGFGDDDSRLGNYGWYGGPVRHGLSPDDDLREVRGDPRTGTHTCSRGRALTQSYAWRGRHSDMKQFSVSQFRTQ